MLFKLFTALSALFCALTVWGGELWRSAALIWQIPALLIGYFVGLVVWQVVFLFLISLVDKNKPVTRRHLFYYAEMVWTLDFALTIGRVRLHVTGEEKLPRDQRFLLVSNHLSMLDPLVCLWRFSDFPTAYISKPENFKIPLVGGIMHMCHFMTIDRENARNAMTTIRRAADLLTEGELNVAVYPEGTRSKSGQLQEFHNGVLKIAQKAEAPVVVMSLKNTEKVMRQFFWKGTDVYIDIATVLPAASFAGKSTAELAQTVREEMVASIARVEEMETKDLAAKKA